MIVIDTSAFVAILLKEPERPVFMATIAADEQRVVSAVTMLETCLVMHGRHGPSGVVDFRNLIDLLAPTIAAFDEKQAANAYQAFTKWGKGINSRSRLNLADCAVYALAKSLNAPLLYKGNDFSATDIVPA